jgi:hypothetical protein
MPAFRLFVTVSLILFAAPRGAAQGPVDLLPQDAAAAIVVHDLDELIKKGDKFLTQTQINVPFRPSNLFDEAVKFLGINQGLNRKRPAAIILMKPEKDGERIGLGSLQTLIVPAIPFTDADAMAGNFGIDKGKLKAKEIVATNKDNSGKFATRTKEHLYLSDSENTLKRLLASKPVAATLSATQRKQLNDADILVHFGRYLWASEFENFHRHVADKIVRGDDPKEREFADLLAESVKEVQHGIAGFRLEDGLSAHFLATVPRNGQAATMLQFLRGKRKPSSLFALPEGNVLFAQASSGDSGQHAVMARSLFHFLLEDLLIQEKIVARTDMLNYLGVFHEVWSRLDGNRGAVYQNADETKQGLFTAVAILDSSDPQGFLREMRTLAKMAVADSLDWSKKEVKEEFDIARLVKDLGHSAYAVRHSAATRLALIGEPSLPFLQKAINSKDLDLETLRRSQALRQRISDVAATRRKELLAEKNQPLFFRPKLTFVTAAEKRLGQNIDVVEVKIAGLEKVAKHQYNQLLGPDWDKVRIAVVGKQLVVMLGSDVDLFEAALRNVQKGDAGLAGTKRLATFHERASKDRLFEFHVSVEGVLRLITPKVEIGTPLHLTSASLSLGETSLQLDAHVPTTEVRAISKKAQAGMQ